MIIANYLRTLTSMPNFLASMTAMATVKAPGEGTPTPQDEQVVSLGMSYPPFIATG